MVVHEFEVEIEMKIELCSVKWSLSSLYLYLIFG
jgi:hypothetical protein